MSSIPISDAKAFDTWLNERWIEKDALLEYYSQHGHFPMGDGEAPPAASNGTTTPQGEIVCPKAGPNHPLEFLQIFVSLLAVPLVWKGVRFLLWIISFFI
jgi:lysocardiolipin and lysophospholipid acyltransferase